MWVARNKSGQLRLFEMPPRRFHDGPILSKELIGFNDSVSVGNDEYSFWAIQEFYKSNRIDNNGAYGCKLMHEKIEDGHKVWVSYEPEFLKDLKWEDEPIEVEITKF